MIPACKPLQRGEESAGRRVCREGLRQVQWLTSRVANRRPSFSWTRDANIEMKVRRPVQEGITSHHSTAHHCGRAANAPPYKLRMCTDNLIRAYRCKVCSFPRKGLLPDARSHDRFTRFK
jgi:hypothetical protein